MQTTIPATILITGATDGIGQALAQHFAQHGYAQRPVRLILIGRRPIVDLDRGFYTDGNYCQVDLAQPACAEQIAEWLAAHQVQSLDLLIHNAGMGYVGAIADQSFENVEQLLAVNLYAPVSLTHRLLPFVEAAQGKIAFISSIVSDLPSPEYAVYAASKAALDGFVRNLHLELAATQSPARAQLIHPGATRSGMHAKSGLSRATVNWERFPPAAQVAAQIADALQSARRRTTIGLLNRLIQWSGRHLPGPVDWAMRHHTLRTAGSHAQRKAPPASQPHVVITGAADGIGKALASAFAQAGYRITGIDVDEIKAARTRDELMAVGASIECIQADLANHDEVTKLINTLVAGPAIHVLIHNAGVNAVGSFAQMKLTPQRTLLDVNLRAPLILTRGLLAAGKIAPGGSVICISSLSRFVSYPGAAVYAASKDGLASYARSLGVALAPNEINVLTVFPGPTRTAHARRYSPDNSREEKRMTPDALASQILAATTARRRSLIPGTINQLVALVGRLCPAITERAMRRAIFEKVVANPVHRPTVLTGRDTE